MRNLIAVVVGVLLAVALLQDAGRSRGAVQAAAPSVQVAVIPGFSPAPYPGTFGVPTFPTTDPQLSAYHFTQVPAAQVTTAELANFDTVVLYGIRWSDLSASAQNAIDAFARTGKVLIWDSDGTGAQSYSTFIHPFSTSVSGENGKANDSVVSFPAGDNFLASSNPSSPYYLDPNQLVTDRNMINDMNAMVTAGSDWSPALVAANKSIPKGGSVIAWSYGVTADHTGLAVYSGIDADAFTDQLNPNYSIKEVALELAAPFLRAPDASCAPSCQPPPTAGGGQPFAACSFAKPLPRGWIHGRVPVVLKTSIASGITGKILNRSGKALVSAKENAAGLIRLGVRTTKLPSNRSSRLRAAVFVNGKQACSKPFSFKVDNVRPRLLLLSTSRSGGTDLVTLRVSEKSGAQIVGRGATKRPHPWVLSTHRLFVLREPGRVRVARLILTDRAGNRLVRRVTWH